MVASLKSLNEFKFGFSVVVRGCQIHVFGEPSTQMGLLLFAGSLQEFKPTKHSDAH